jgi:hypothetical protein
MHDIVIRRGDTLPLIRKTLYLGGNPVDLTGYDVEFTVNHLDGSTDFFTNDADIVVPAANGVVEYQWTNQDTTDVTDDVAFAFFKATQGTDIFTVPNHRPLSILLTSTTKHEYSYSGDPAARPIDRVRFLLQDTNMDTAFFTDSEIEFTLTEYSSPYATAAELALVQSSKFTNLADKTVGPLSINYGNISERWLKFAASLRNRGRSGSGAQVIMTQVSRGPHVRLGMHDNPVVADDANNYPDNLLGEEL